MTERGESGNVAPFAGFQMDFYYTEIVITSITASAVPGAIWLFASGLAGMARRRRTLICNLKEKG
jgi:hypothetical protein